MLEVRLIGKFDIKYGGKPVTISSRASQSLFSYLILNVGTAHRREKLAGMFWPYATEEKARAYLRHELWRIRKAFSNSEFLLSDDLSISFDSATEYWLDAEALKKLTDAPSKDEFTTALSTYEGELLSGFYDEWIILERERLQSLYEQKMARLMEMLNSENCWHEILEWAERWISFGQRSEAPYRHQMIAYSALGEKAKVTATYERCVQALAELGLKPSEETRALVGKWISSLNIPIPRTSFVGRETELKEVAALLSKSRLVTLTGTGGIGKTRLAIEVVAEVLNRFPDGAWFLDLAPLSDPALVPNTLASVLGLHESGDTRSTVTDLIINYLGSRKTLVIFDNCEHLIGTCARMADLLLTACKDLSILATSRQSLRVSGEIPYRLPSLEVPRISVDERIHGLANSTSVRLFVERAAMVSPSFAINPQNVFDIAQICQRLDGIPLAIELAAARTNMMTVGQIAKRLDDCFNLLTRGSRSVMPRHQTLRAAIEWSYDLLSEQEHILFRRLAVFKGGWSLEATEAVCSQVEGMQINTLELLDRLVERSLIFIELNSTQSEMRFEMLETIQQFAREKLANSGEEEQIRARHLDYFLKLAHKAEIELYSTSQIEWLQKLRNEHENMRAALDWADNTDVEAGLSLTGNLHRFWETFEFREGSSWLSKFLQKQESYAYPRARAKALCMYGWSLVSLQQQDAARSRAKECLDLCRVFGDQLGEVDGLLLLAWVSSNMAQKKEFNQQALELAQSLGDVRRKASALWQLGWLYQDENRFVYWKKAITLTRSLGNWRGLAGSLSTTGFFLLLNGDMESAQKHLDESNRLYRQLNLNPPPTHLLSAYSQIALIRGDFKKARAYLEESTRINVEFGSRQGYLWARIRLGYVALREGNLTEACLCFRETARSFQEDKYEIGVVYALEAMASLFVAADKFESAARLIGWANATREKISDKRPILEQADVDRDLTAIIAKIGNIAFEEVRKGGADMTLDAAVAFALEELS